MAIKSLIPLEPIQTAMALFFLRASEYREVCNGHRRLVGTFGYLAPEVFRGQEYTIQSDLWSVGLILYILMTVRDTKSAVRDNSNN